GAEQIILLGNNPERIALGREVGATDVVSERGEEAVESVRELTEGLGAHSVLECVGLEQAVDTALEIARPGGAVGRVGIPEHDTPPTGVAIWKNASIAGGPAPCARVHRGASARRSRRQDRTGPGLRPLHEPRRRARRLPGDERARSDQGHRRTLSLINAGPRVEARRDGPVFGNDPWEEGTPPPRGRGSTTDASAQGMAITQLPHQADATTSRTSTPSSVTSSRLSSCEKFALTRSPAARAFSPESKMIIARPFNSPSRVGHVQSPALKPGAPAACGKTTARSGTRTRSRT